MVEAGRQCIFADTAAYKKKLQDETEQCQGQG